MFYSWWRHQIETFSALLAICAGNSPVPVNSPHKGQWRGALMFSLISAWINGWANNREASDLRRNSAHYDVIAMRFMWIALLGISSILHAHCLWFFDEEDHILEFERAKYHGHFYSHGSCIHVAVHMKLDSFNHDDGVVIECLNLKISIVKLFRISFISFFICPICY